MEAIECAIRYFRCAIRLQDDFHRAIYNLGAVLYAYGELMMDLEERSLFRTFAAINLSAAHCLQPSVSVYRDAVHLTRQ